MDLVFIYLSIIMFISVHVLIVSSLLPPMALLQLLPVISPASGLCLCSKKCWGWRARKDMLWEVHLGPGSPVRI